jgi:Cu(I)/Ag(I) efflux system membrane protein CusA/SilA
VHEAIRATIGGIDAATTVQGRERYAVNVRYPRELRDDVDDLQRVLVPTAAGQQIPLGQVARIHVVQGPMAVKTEDAFPVTSVFIDLTTDDIGGYVQRAQAQVAQELVLPAGYTVVWSGQFAFMERVAAKMRLVIPLTLAIVLLLLYLNFRSVTESLIVMLSVPFALTGGVWYLWFAGYNTSVAVWVGFIALAGVAAETGVVMLMYLDQAFERRRSAGTVDRAGIVEAVREGAVDRLRPKLMTVLTIILGLSPILWSSGTGADVMKRIAAPMVGGMVSSTVLTLVVLPAIYLLWRRRHCER